MKLLITLTWLTQIANATESSGFIIVFISVVGDEKLTSTMILNLAESFHNEPDIHRLAEDGLGMNINAVNTALANNKNINMAMHDVLQKWRVSMPTAEAAFSTLHATLLRVNMSDRTSALQ